tara:strand:- start:7603 stop:9732 length:2130 start_codon:yes stop_codon:yes gene_type:complete
VTTVNDEWMPIITTEYLKVLGSVNSPLFDDDNFELVVDIIKGKVNQLYADNSNMTTEELAINLIGDTDLRESIAKTFEKVLEDQDFASDLGDIGGFNINTEALKFMPEVTSDFKDWDKAPESKVVTAIEQSELTQQQRVANEGWLTSFESYMETSARVNELVIVPELFRHGQTLRNLQRKGWIRKLVPKNEDKIADAVAALFADDEDDDTTEADEAEATIASYDDTAERLSGGVMADEGAYWVFTEQATDGFNDWLASVFTEEELLDFYEANGINPNKIVYEDLLAMTDLMSSNFTISDRSELIYNLTGDETLSPENAFIELSNGMRIAENDVELVSQATQFSRSQIKRIAEKASEKHGGLDSGSLPWQIIALAIEQADDYQDDQTGGLITENINLGVKKFNKYVEEYEKALNIYTDGQTTHYELAYLHLLSPDLANKIMQGGHDQLTVGEVNFINSAFNTIDTFHNRTGQFSPGWSLNMSTKNWLQGLSPGRMTDSYLTEAQIDSIIASGDIEAIVAAGTYAAGGEYGTQEEADLAQLDATKKAVAEKTYSDLYKQWFMDDPTDVELERFMGWHASKEADYRREVASWSPYTSGQYTNPNDINDPTLLSQRTALSVEEALRNDPQYAQLYGRKPTGMSETQYGQVFSTQAMADYGQSGMLNTDLIKKGMASGDTGDITREGILTGEGYDNSQYMKKIMTLRNAVRRNT